MMKSSIFYSLLSLIYSALFLGDVQAGILDFQDDKEWPDFQDAGWSRKHLFKPSPSAIKNGTGYGFGESHAISGQYIAIGDVSAILHSSNITQQSNFMQGSVSLFDKHSGQRLYEFRAPDKGVERFGCSVALSSQYLLVGTDSRRAYLFDLQTKQKVYTFSRESDSKKDYMTTQVALSDSHALIAFDLQESYLFDLNTGEQVHKFTAESGDCKSSETGVIALSERHVAMRNCANKSVDLFDVNTGELLHQFTKRDIFFGSAVALSGEHLLIGSKERGAYLFDLTTYDQLYKLDDDGDYYLFEFGQYVALSQDYAVVAATSGGVYFYSKESGELAFRVVNNEWDASFYYHEPVCDPSNNDVLISEFFPLTIGGGSRSRPIDDETAPRVSLYRSDSVATESSSVIALSSMYIKESVGVGAVVGQLTTPGLDAQDSLTYSLVSGVGSEGNATFVLDGRNLMTNQPLDYETQEAYSIRIQAQGELTGSVEKVFRIGVIDDQSEDVDGDGLTEELEEYLYGSSDTTKDTDNDGYSDFAEVISGTLPFDTNSQPTAGDLQEYISFDEDEFECFGKNVSLSGAYFLVGRTLYNIETREIVHKFAPAHQGSGAELDCESALSGDYALIRGQSFNERGESTDVAYLFDIYTGQQVYTFDPLGGEPHRNEILSVALTGDHALLVSKTLSSPGTSSEAGYLFDVHSGELIHRFDAPEGSGRFGDSVALSDDYALMSSAVKPDEKGEGIAAYLFELQTGALVHQFEGDFFHDRKVALSQEYALISGADQSSDTQGYGAQAAQACLYDLNSKEQVAVLSGPRNQYEKRVTSLALSDNHALVGYECMNYHLYNWGGAYLYDLETHQHVNSFLSRDFQGHDHFRVAADLSNNHVVVGANPSNSFVSSDSEHGAYVYPLDYKTLGFDDAAKAAGLTSWLDSLSSEGFEKRGVTHGVAYALGLPLSGELTRGHRRRVPRAVRRSSNKFALGLNLPESIPDDVTLCVMQSETLGADAEWTEVARKEGNTSWSGVAEVTEGALEEGVTEVLINPQETDAARGFMKLEVILEP